MKKNLFLWLLFIAATAVILRNELSSPPSERVLLSAIEHPKVLDDDSKTTFSDEQMLIIKKALLLGEPNSPEDQTVPKINLPLYDGKEEIGRIDRWSVFLSESVTNYFWVSNRIPSMRLDSQSEHNVLLVWGIMAADERLGWKDIPSLSSSIVQDRLLEWMEPILKEMWRNDPHRAVHRKALADTESFLRTTNIALERERLKNGEFLEFDAHGNPRSNPKLEAFILRRILSNEISQDRFIVLFDRFAKATERWDDEFAISAENESFVSRQ